MKLRYYMRGLGIGILVTAILMSVTLNGKTEKLTDEEIIARAEELGMVQEYENIVLADTVSDNEAEEKIEEKIPDTSQEKPQAASTDSEEPEETEETEDPQEAEGVQEQPVQEIITDETVQIVVQGGDGSQTVARKLAEAGLVEDMTAYDKYLCRNGYDKRICTGTHTIPVGATEEEIAKIITSRP